MMRTRVVPALLGFALVVAPHPALQAPAAAQEEQPRGPKMSCWRGAPRPDCGGFFLVEAQGVFPLLETTRTWSYPNGPRIRVHSFESRLEWNLGYMVNVSQDWAVGGAFTLGTGSYDALTGVRARVRRWLGPQLSLELEGGTVVTHAQNAGNVLFGITADARLNVADRGSFFLRWDGVDIPEERTPTGDVWDSGGFQHALQVGVSTGSTWTVIGTGALAVWLAIVLVSLDPS